MIGHREAQALISARLDGPLDPAANRELSAHLATCEECRAFADQTHVMARGLRDLPLLPASPTVRRGVYDHIDQRRLGRGWWPSRGALAPLAVAAILVLVVAGTVLAATLPRLRDNDDAVRIGAPVFETSTVVAAVPPAGTATATATAPATVTSAPATSTALPTATATATAPATVTSAPATSTALPTATATRQPFDVTFATATVVTATTTAAPAPQTMTPGPTATVALAPPAAGATAALVAPTVTNTPQPDIIAAAAPTTTPSATPRPTATPERPTATLVPTDTPVPPTATVEPTATPVPPTATVEPTETPVPPTATVEPTETPVPPTATVEPTETPVPPTATVEPTETPVPPTATVEPTETPVPPAATVEPTETPVPPTATVEPTETPSPAGPPTIAPQGGTGDVATATSDASQAVGSTGVVNPTATAQPARARLTATLTPPPVATDPPPSPIATAAPVEPDMTCPAGVEDGVSGPPTIAPMGGDVPAANEDDECVPARTPNVPDTNVATATVATAPQPTSTVPGMTPGAVEIPTGETVTDDETPSPDAVGGNGPTVTIVTIGDVTATAAPIVPDSSAAVETENAPEGVTLPGSTATTDAAAVAGATTDETSATEESTGVDAAAEIVVAGLPATRTPGGPLAMSPDQDRFVVGTNGERLWIVDLNGEQVEIAGSEPFYPTWSPDGSQILVAFYPENPDGSVLGVVDANTGRVTNLTAQDGDSLTRDVPAGWLGQTPVFQRTYLNEPDRGVELWRAGDDAPFWSMDALEVYTAHPISVGQSFLLATSGGWLQVAADGGSTNLGPSAITERFTELVVGPAGMLAYAGQGQLVLAPLEAPGNLSGTFSYDGNGFDWSPDGSRLAVAAGSELLVLTPNGEVQATLAISSGGFVSGPYWTSQGILYMDSAANALQRVAAPS